LNRRNEIIKKRIAYIAVTSFWLLYGCAAPAAQTAAGGSQTSGGPEPRVSAPAAAEVSKDSSDYYIYDYNDVERKYMLYIPEGAGSGAPLVFMLHGDGGSSKSFMEYTGMNRAAEKYGYAVVYPQGISPKTKAGTVCWNSSFTPSGNDDLGFLAALAKYLQQTYGFSSSKTFAAGFSNGAFMMYEIACGAPGTFRAVASVAGSMGKKLWDDRRDDQLHVGVLQINGTKDNTVPMDSSLTANGGYGGAPAIGMIIEYWKNINSLDEFQKTDLSDKAVAYKYSSDENENAVWYIEIEGFGHEWPKEETAGFDAGEVILEFFSNFVE